MKVLGVNMWNHHTIHVILVVYIVSNLGVEVTASSSKVGCSDWKDVAADISSQFNKGDLCQKKADCNGVTCFYSDQSYVVTVDVTATRCTISPPVLKIWVNAPLLGVLNFTQVIAQNEVVTLPSSAAAHFGLKEIVVNVTMHHKGQELVLGATALGRHGQSSEWDITKLLMKEHRIPVSPCENVYGKALAPVSMPVVQARSTTRIQGSVKCSTDSFDGPHVCDLSNNELCRRNENNPQVGYCDCADGFSMDKNGRCRKDKSLETTTVAASTYTKVNEALDEPEKRDAAPGPSGTTVAISVVMSLLLLAVVAGLVYVGIKFRFCYRLRFRAFGIRSGDTMLVDSEDMDNGTAAIA